MNKLESNKLNKEEFEAKHNMVGFFNLLLQIDKRTNSKLYENNRDTNNTD